MMIPLIEDDCEIKKEVPKEFFSPQRCRWAKRSAPDGINPLVQPKAGVIIFVCR
jgi:hypothetical protein